MRGIRLEYGLAGGLFAEWIDEGEEVVSWLSCFGDGGTGGVG